MRQFHVSTGGMFWQCLRARKWIRVRQPGELPACHFNLGPRQGRPWPQSAGSKVFGLTREFAKSAQVLGLAVF